MPTALVVGTNTYRSLADVTAYLEDSIRAAAWAFVDPDDQTRSIHTAMRIIEKQCWQGTKTVLAQVLAFPRTGLTDKNGVALDPTIVPTQVGDGLSELSFEVSQNPDLETLAGTGSNNKRLRAGEAEIEYFRPTGGVNGLGSQRFPPVVQELLGQFMCGAGGMSTPFASGTDVESQFDTDDGFGLSEGYP